MKKLFSLRSDYTPKGDQPNAIKNLIRGIKSEKNHQTLLGVTGSGKTYTVANVIENIGKPTLVLAHNKTLAAQLAQEYSEFFPDASVNYFVSYYDYYQPEAYIPISDTYIEKEAQINEEIDRLRHSSTQALLTRKDVIIVASVSCIYGLGSPKEYKESSYCIDTIKNISRGNIINNLINIHYNRVSGDVTNGTFRSIGSSMEVMPPHQKVIYRILFEANKVKRIEVIDYITREIKQEVEKLFLFPAKHFIASEDVRKKVVKEIKKDLKESLMMFERQKKPLEAERLKRVVLNNISLILEIGYCPGIENYSRYFDGREKGDPPSTLLSYFPKKDDGTPDFLTIIDESHITIPQLSGMYNGDRSRKENLVNYGFRLPSAIDNRPLTFDEFNERVGQIIYTSATPGEYELEKSGKDGIIEQIIRPTGLLDPEIKVLGVSEKGEYKGQIKNVEEETLKVIKNKGRVLITTLTKKMSEDLSQYFEGRNIKARYLHSDIKTIERIEILTDFRKGKFDVLIGVNLLREGLDLPEIELVCILNADSEGFLRSLQALIQTMGRAARNVNGRVILYADNLTDSLKNAIKETERRRKIQIEYNKDNGITPKTIIKKIGDITEKLSKKQSNAVESNLKVHLSQYKKHPKRLIKALKEEMSDAVKILDFETAAVIRDEIRLLEKKNSKK